MLRAAEILVAPFRQNDEWRYAVFTSIVKDEQMAICIASTLERAVEMATERLREEGYDLATIDVAESKEQIDEFTKKVFGK